MTRRRTPGYLLLEDGARFGGDAFIGDSPALGEAVFNTAHSGYQEVLTDPSYRRQIMVFTTPHIGNVGVNDADAESSVVHAAGAVVRSLSPRPRSWRSQGDFAAWMLEAGVPLLSGVDTRAVTLHLRTRGAVRAGLFPADVPFDRALEQVLKSPPMTGADLAAEATCRKPYRFTGDDLNPEWHPRLANPAGLRVALLDFGVKRNILRELARRGCEVTVFPAATPAVEITSGGFAGVLLSNGPGDPAALGYAVESVGNLLETGLPLFGICLGHQLLALALGLKTYKLKFGHRGANHPVRREVDRTVEITSQNHGFAVAPEHLPDGWRVSHTNLNDGTVEGLEAVDKPVFSVQYHPEASPGPHDSLTYFDRFIREMNRAGA